LGGFHQREARLSLLIRKVGKLFWQKRLGLLRKVIKELFPSRPRKKERNFRKEEPKKRLTLKGLGVI